MKSIAVFLFAPLLFLVSCTPASEPPPLQGNRNFFTPRNWQIPITQPEEKKEPVPKIEEKSAEPVAKAEEPAPQAPEQKPAPVTPIKAEEPDEQMIGIASWYGPGFQGEKTANGENYNQEELTAAHKLLPMNTWVQVTNLENDKTVVVRINDRGPFEKDRIIDLTRKGAEMLDFKEQGTARVSLKVVKYPKDYDSSQGLEPYKQVVVQIAVFSTQQRADSFQLQLSQKYTKIPFLIEIKGDLYYVLAGPYKEKETAEQVGEALEKEGVENFVRSYKK